MRVVIVGGGVGGLALARGLRAADVEVVVLERHHGPDPGGAAVTIFSNGAAALEGLGAGLGDRGAAIAELEVRRASGGLAMRADLTRLSRRFGFGVRTVPRHVLLEHLGAGDRDVVHYGRQVVAVMADRPAVQTADGEVHEGDVVVGADGHRSAVRAAVLDPAPAASVGWTTWQGLTPVLPDVAGGRTGVLTVGPAGLVGTMPAGAGLCHWWFDVPSETVDDIAPLDRLRSAFAGYAEPVPSLLDSIGAQDLARFGHVVHRVEAQWGTGPTTLIGDAAHVFPPSQAQGANQAIEDAWLLTAALVADGRASGSLVGRLRRFESLRARRVRLVSRMATSERTNRPASAGLAALTRTIPPAVAGAGYARLVKRFSSVLNGDDLLVAGRG